MKKKKKYADAKEASHALGGVETRQGQERGDSKAKDN